MWAYLAAYKTPHDDARGAGSDGCTSTTRSRRPGARARRAADRAPAARARRDRRADGPSWRALDRVLVWTHWVLVRGAARRARLHPAAPPRALPARRGDDLRGLRPRRQSSTGWCRPRRPGMPADEPVRDDTARDAAISAVRRMMVEYGEHFWRDSWGPLYSVLEAIPWPRCPRCTSPHPLMAALLLAEAGPLAGALGWRLRARRSASRWSTSASTTSVDLLGGAR